MFRIVNGDSLIELDKLEPSSIDSIVCDPPYEINFMNKGWDNSGIAYNVDLWKKCLNVLKSGSFMLVFGGSRTFHRVMCAIEDAGFYIKDTMMWFYGSGFPKGENIGLAIDKRNGVESKVVATMDAPSLKDTAEKQKELGNGSIMTFGQISNAKRLQYEIKEAQNEWNGWNTALKPAFEVIIVAQKPIEEKTIVDNVLKWGVGAYNIDECRIPISSEDDYDVNNRPISKAKGSDGDGHFLDELHDYDAKHGVTNKGRYPSNLILTYDDETFNDVCGGFPDTKSSPESPNANHTFKGNKDAFEWGFKDRVVNASYNDNGNACRYFYSAKASKRDRDEGLDFLENKEFILGSNGASLERIREKGYYGNGANGFSQIKMRKNNHPAVKPTNLLQYLIKLVTPKGGIVLDPFMGSGSTGKAVAFENNERNANYSFIGIELSKEYCEIANARISWANNYQEIETNVEIEKNIKANKKTDIFDFLGKE